jgi:excinuclease ABC subunit B
MERALAETSRRRTKQLAHNAEHGITPQGIQKKIADVMSLGAGYDTDAGELGSVKGGGKGRGKKGPQPVLTPEQMAKRIKQMETRMQQHARNLEFEEAARLRDEIGELRNEMLGVGKPGMAKRAG